MLVNDGDHLRCFAGMVISPNDGSSSSLGSAERAKIPIITRISLTVFRVFRTYEGRGESIRVLPVALIEGPLPYSIMPGRIVAQLECIRVG